MKDGLPYGIESSSYADVHAQLHLDQPSNEFMAYMPYFWAGFFLAKETLSLGWFTCDGLPCRISRHAFAPQRKTRWMVVALDLQSQQAFVLAHTQVTYLCVRGQQPQEC